METNKKTQILPILVATLVIMAIAAAPALAKSSKKSSSQSSACCRGLVNRISPSGSGGSEGGTA